MLQLLGGVLLLFACLGIGGQLTQAERRCVKQTEGFLLLLRHVQQGILTYADPLRDIYGRFQNPALEACGFLVALREKDFLTALEDCRPRLCLREKEIETLSAFAREVGKSYAGDQAKLCDYTIGELEKAFQREREEAPKRIKSIGALSLCLGLMLLCLLY